MELKSIWWKRTIFFNAPINTLYGEHNMASNLLITMGDFNWILSKIVKFRLWFHNFLTIHLKIWRKFWDFNFIFTTFLLSYCAFSILFFSNIGLIFFKLGDWPIFFPEERLFLHTGRFVLNSLEIQKAVIVFTTLLPSHSMIRPEFFQKAIFTHWKCDLYWWKCHKRCWQ